MIFLRLVLFQGFFIVSIESGNEGYYEFDSQLHKDVDQEGKHHDFPILCFTYVEGLYYLVARVGYHVVPFFAISMFRTWGRSCLMFMISGL